MRESTSETGSLLTPPTAIESSQAESSRPWKFESLWFRRSVCRFNDTVRPSVGSVLLAAFGSEPESRAVGTSVKQTSIL
jgi:hypothetical protein